MGGYLKQFINNPLAEIIWKISR